ncbi:MAG: ribosome-binding ATPase YchF [Patescibacteria group bacterium]|nr:MAG: ribosome-binding ATPase YchF [Patescibacteria group bacterium]
MSLSIGIVGLPNVGKSTLFNALLRRQAALAANYPFATIEPNIGIVDVPDPRLYDLAQYVRNDYGAKSGDREIPEKIIAAVVKFYDIAGLVKGASKGEGLGNEFLGHIREVDAVVQVVRDFSDENVVRAGAVNPEEDIQTINTELILADLQSLEKKVPTLEKELKTSRDPKLRHKLEVIRKIRETLDRGDLASSLNLEKEEIKLLKDLNLLTMKPMIVVLNTDESKLSTLNTQNIYISGKEALVICAKIEAELADFSESERASYMKELGISEPGLNRLIRKSYELLDLESFLTMGPKEVRAWTFTKGDKAPRAAGKIHTDFERGFISAEVINYEDLRPLGSLKKAKEKGLVRLEGKNYTMKDGDVVEFHFSV